MSGQQGAHCGTRKKPLEKSITDLREAGGAGGQGWGQGLGDSPQSLQSPLLLREYLLE